jgi:hypothetical protein
VTVVSSVGVGSTRARQLRRQRQRTERRRDALDAQARDAQRLQDLARARRDVREKHVRHLIAYSLFVVAAVIAVLHFFEHAGAVRVMSAQAEDLLMGWPIAASLALVGGIVYGT